MLAEFLQVQQQKHQNALINIGRIPHSHKHRFWENLAINAFHDNWQVLTRLISGVIMSWALLPWALAYLYFMWWRPAHHLEQVDHHLPHACSHPILKMSITDQHHHCPCSCFYRLGYPQHSSSSSKPFLIFSIGSNYYTLNQSVCHHFSLLWVLLSLNPSQESHHTTATKDEDKDKDKDKKEMFWERQSPPAHSGWGPLLVELERSNKTVLWDRLVLLPFFPFQIHLNIEQIIPKELEREFGVLYKRTIWMFHDMELQKVYL